MRRTRRHANFNRKNRKEKPIDFRWRFDARAVQSEISNLKSEIRIMPLKTQIDEQPSLNLTPMIDIVFLLIIFFMVGTKFSELERKMDLEPPSVAENGALTAPPRSKVVNVFRDGRIELDNRQVSISDLSHQLAAAHSQYPGIRVLVRGDADGRFQTVATVLNVCSQAGINRLGVSVKVSDRAANRQRAAWK